MGTTRKIKGRRLKCQSTLIDDILNLLIDRVIRIDFELKLLIRVQKARGIGHLKSPLLHRFKRLGPSSCVYKRLIISSVLTCTYKNHIFIKNMFLHSYTNIWMCFFYVSSIELLDEPIHSIYPICLIWRKMRNDK